MMQTCGQHASLRMPNPIWLSHAPQPLGDLDHVGSNFVKQLSRRSQIFALTRNMLAELGHDGVYMEDLANRMGVAKQTIYNTVGKKQDVIASAISEHVVSMARVAEKSGTSIYSIMAMIELYCENFSRYGEYCRNASVGMFMRDRALCAKVRAYQRILFMKWLQEASMERLLRDSVSVSQLVEQIVVLNEGNIQDWVNGMCGTLSLCQSLVWGHGMMLASAMKQEQAKIIESWVEAVALGSHFTAQPRCHYNG